jgi:hypothetical protein
MAHGGIVGGHGSVHPHLLARFVHDARRAGLAGGAHHYRSGEFGDHRADGAERPRRGEVWHPVPGARARTVRNVGRARAFVVARPSGLRLVRSERLDRRTFALLHLVSDHRQHRRCRSFLRQVHCLWRVLDHQHLLHLERHRADQMAGGLERTGAHRDRHRAAGLGRDECWRLQCNIWTRQTIAAGHRAIGAVCRSSGPHVGSYTAAWKRRKGEGYGISDNFLGN